METFVIIVFVLGYVAITMEHKLKLDKLIPALIMMVLAWTAVAFGLEHFPMWFDSVHEQLMDGTNGTVNFATQHLAEKQTILEETLLHHFGKTAEILIFLVGAMTIVEIVDHFNGFSTIKQFIKTKKKSTLLWLISILAFVLSSIIDNLTATIVLITILRKIVNDKELRMWFAGFIIIAANAGGAWSPIGDVTTTMLWIGDKVTTLKLIEQIALPSIICIFVPLIIATFLPIFKGEIEDHPEEEEKLKHGGLMLVLGLLMIVFVPIFKTVTHLPPYIGMMFSLAVVATVAEVITNRHFALTYNEGEEHVQSPTFKALSRIEMPSVLFFLGILMTVAALESLGTIFIFGADVRHSISENLFVTLLGAGSAIIDNVPLVAASMGMFQEPIDHEIWHFIAYAAGTGGSLLIIGSAAGVVAMGMEKISFFWYMKKISWLALIGYLCGVATILLFD